MMQQEFKMLIKKTDALLECAKSSLPARTHRICFTLLCFTMAKHILHDCKGRFAQQIREIIKTYDVSFAGFTQSALDDTKTKATKKKINAIFLREIAQKIEEEEQENGSFE